MKTYVVEWVIDLEADRPIDAARRALEIHRDNESIATQFKVTDQETGLAEYIDLYELDETNAALSRD